MSVWLVKVFLLIQITNSWFFFCYYRILPATKAVAVATTSNSKSKTTTGGPKTALNGMDALCTAAAMMADDDEGVEVVETEVANQVSAFKTLSYECDMPRRT